jgi:site-specific DNA-methyltransferase (adenine-specific)/site-specific DNA-methyltransferase (cytosine-N4-specific)
MKLEDYINKLVHVFHEVKRTLKSDGTFWLNIGDGYTSGGRTWRDSDKKNKGRGMDYRAPTPDGLKPKDLIGVPWRVAFALQADGWYLRSEVIWYKPNAQPESVKDRPTRAHEHVFLFSKNEQYFYDHEAVREKGDNGSPRNLRSVWQVNTEPYAEAHFATFPRALILPCLLAGSKQDSTVLDPFLGSGTVGLVSGALGRKFVGIELNPEYAQLARKRLSW